MPSQVSYKQHCKQTAATKVPFQIQDLCHNVRLYSNPSRFFLRPRSFGASVMHTILKHFIGLNIKYQALEKHEMTDHNSKKNHFLRIALFTISAHSA